jgi:hypothetical protein
MMLRLYTDEDWQPAAELFATTFGYRCRSIATPTRQGLMRDLLQEWNTRHPESDAWVAVESGAIVGFISAHLANDGAGIISCPVCHPDGDGVFCELIEMAERFLRERGATNASVAGLSKEYGVAFGTDLHTSLLNNGYETCDVSGIEYVLEIDLGQLSGSPMLQEYRSCNEGEGYVFEFLREEHVGSLKEFAPEWSLRGLEAPFATDPVQFPLAICRKDDTVIGYCGTCRLPNKYGQAGWSFILLRDIEAEECPHAGRGIGAVLLFMANQWLKERGAKFQTLVTGVGNRTQRLYRKAGYRYCFVQAKDIRKSLVC